VVMVMLLKVLDCITNVIPNQPAITMPLDRVPFNCRSDPRVLGGPFPTPVGFSCHGPARLDLP
jgi:hypothetical protein